MEYTPEQMAEILELYNRCYHYISLVMYCTRSDRARFSTNGFRSANYLLKTGIPQMKEHIPSQVLRKLDLDLDNLEEICKRLSTTI